MQFCALAPRLCNVHFALSFAGAGKTRGYAGRGYDMIRPTRKPGGVGGHSFEPPERSFRPPPPPPKGQVQDVSISQPSVKQRGILKSTCSTPRPPRHCLTAAPCSCEGRSLSVKLMQKLKAEAANTAGISEDVAKADSKNPRNISKSTAVGGGRQFKHFQLTEPIRYAVLYVGGPLATGTPSVRFTRSCCPRKCAFPRVMASGKGTQTRSELGDVDHWFWDWGLRIGLLDHFAAILEWLCIR